MAFQGNKDLHMVSSEESFADQYFLLNFIMSAYLGPDVYSETPRRSASQRLAEGLAPYTSKNLGFSYVSISQLESLYYYVLKHAHPSLVVKPSVLYMYLKGKLSIPSSVSSDNCRQFTSYFPLNVHEHKKYSGCHEVIKGIVLIDDPITSYMKQEDLIRFRVLSGMDDLRIDRIKSLCYQHEYQKDREEGAPPNVKKTKEMAGGNISNIIDKASESLQEMKDQERHCEHVLSPAAPHVVSVSENNNGRTMEKSCERDGQVMMPLLTVPDLAECKLNASLTGTARKGIIGPPVGVVDVGVSKPAYFFRVALPGVKRDYSLNSSPLYITGLESQVQTLSIGKNSELGSTGEFSCEIESSGKVHIQGSTSGGKTIKKRSRVFQMNLQQLCPPGEFTVSFSLPGPVDPRLFSPNFRSDGIFEAVVIKHK